MGHELIFEHTPNFNALSLLTYLLFQLSVPVNYFFVNIRWFYLNKFCDWSSVFCMFFMALTRPSLTVQLTSGVDVFAHLCGQKADTSSNYCDNIQPYDETFQIFFKCNTILDFFLKLPQIRTSKFRKVAWQHTKGTVGSIICFVRNLVIFQQ